MVIKNIVIGQNSTGVAVNPITNLIYISKFSVPTVSVIDGKTNAVSDTIHVGTNVYGISVNPSTGMIYAGNDSSGIVYVISDSEKPPTVSHDILDDILQFLLRFFNLK